MPNQKVSFQNKEGYQLAARLEMPIDQAPHSYAIFAHCFTCNKNLTAVRNISSALNQHGVAVLRFDFTGLGDSEGDFSDTNFSSNLDDLIAAADYLSTNHQPPALLIGHSLGGAAVISVANQLPSVKAVATINSPYDPAHVSHVFGDQNDEIENKGEAEVRIGGRPFRVKRQFLADIAEQRQIKKINNLNRALLILHSPQDRIVAIENAAKIYHAARHPKSFVTLDGADHLLSAKADSRYAGQVIASWSSRYLEIPIEDELRSDREVVVRIGAEGFTTDIMVRHHGLTADEPLSIGGNDYGPSPYELLSASLGACTAMTIQMYARRKKWEVQEVIVHLSHRKDYAKDMANVDETNSKIDYFERIVELKGNLDDTQRARLLEIANKCPVHRTLHGDIKVNTLLR
jgi:putative redox protein